MRPLVAGLLGALLVLPSVAVGFFQDDLTLRALARGEPSPLGTRAPWDLFRFYADPEVVHAMREQGLAPWWTDPELRLAFFRPLSSLWHWLDFRLFPDLPAVHHLGSVLLYGLVAWGVARAYRQLEADPRVAGLASLLWAIDDAHGMPVGWISNRNAVLAWGLAVLAVALHDRWRRLGWRPGALLAPMAALAGLLAGEAALGAWGYLLAHALFLDRGSVRERFVALAPYGLLLAAWRAAYQLGGYGTNASAFYVDPGHDPLAFLRVMAVRVPALLGALLGPVPVDLAMALPDAGRAVLFAALAAIAALGALVLAPVVRADPVARFHALGMVLACVPVAATLPSERLVAIAGFGGMALLARVALTSRPILVGVVHGLMAAVLLPLRSVAVLVPHAGQQLAAETLPATPEVVVVSAPDWFVPAFGAQQAAVTGAPLPDALRLLATTTEPLSVARPDERTLVLTSEGGFLTDALALVPRAGPLVAGERFEVGGWRIAVEDARQGNPTVLRFEAPTPLEDPRRAWTTWRTGEGLVPFELPAAGGRVELPAAPP